MGHRIIVREDVLSWFKKKKPNAEEQANQLEVSIVDFIKRRGYKADWPAQTFYVDDLKFEYRIAPDDLNINELKITGIIGNYKTSETIQHDENHYQQIDSAINNLLERLNKLRDPKVFEVLSLLREYLNEENGNDDQNITKAVYGFKSPLNSDAEFSLWCHIPALTYKSSSGTETLRFDQGPINLKKVFNWIRNKVAESAV